MAGNDMVIYIIKFMFWDISNGPLVSYEDIKRKKQVNATFFILNVLKTCFNFLGCEFEYRIHYIYDD